MYKGSERELRFPLAVAVSYLTIACSGIAQFRFEFIPASEK
jgi:hypothetical protein